jgi:FlaA1/EpsC-like NDP-sugar epimerase
MQYLTRIKNVPGFIILTIDLVAVFISTWIAFFLRFNFKIPDKEINVMPYVLGTIILVRFLIYFLFKTHRSIIRYTGIHDNIRVFIANILGSFLFVIINIITYKFINGNFLIPLSIVILELMITTFIIWVYRTTIKMAYLEITNPSRVRQKVIIYGAGIAGLNAKSAIDRDAGLKYKVVAFIDDDPKKENKKIEDVTIHSYSKLDSLIEGNTIAHLIISIQNINKEKKKEIVDKCYSHNVKVLIVPPTSRWINGELSFKQIKRIKIEELLERDEIVFDKKMIKPILTGKNILVTGAAGSIGSEIVRQITQFKYNRLILLDNAETPIYYLNNELTDKAEAGSYKIIIEDICNKPKLEKIFEDEKIDVVFHAAAYKHVPMMENNPAAAIKVNVGGTKNLADLAVQFNIEKFVMISTDKAVNPTSVMGASKRIAEIYVQALSKSSKTMFITTRFGNVLGSNGSVIPLFREQIEKGGPITITHPEVTRFFMTIPEACRLVLVAGALGEGGEIFMFDMGDSVKIVELAKKMITLSGLTLGRDIQIKFTGLRPGEKLYEELLADSENTIPTSHKQIMKAKVRDNDFDTVNKQINNLIASMSEDNKTIVQTMKHIVPEYISQNSIFEILDIEAENSEK